MLNIHPVFRLVDTCAGEFNSKTPYLYSTYDWNFDNERFCEANPTNKNKIIILGGGPNRIGQGIEFDYCCVHAVYALKEKGIETIMINCNPETVSTDYDTADRLYFEPLSAESVIEIYNKESCKGNVLGVLVQFGGQTPLKIAKDIELAGINIIGTSTEAIDLAEDRDRFSDILNSLNISQPKNGFANSVDQTLIKAKEIGYPVLIRPSYVLGGRAMQIAYNKENLEIFSKEAMDVSSNNVILIDQYLENAKEIDVDLIRDKDGEIFIAGIMEHIEEAGVHSGDSACSLPPHSLQSDLIGRIEDETRKLALSLNVIGLMNIQFAVKDNSIFVLEVNPRASRTIPFVSKSIGIPLAGIAARILTGEKLTAFSLQKRSSPYFSVKEAVLPFDRFPGVDTILGPEMRSTGEVMGIAESFDMAFLKAQLGAGVNLPKRGNVFISVKDNDKNLRLAETAEIIKRMGFRIYATTGTAKFLKRNKISAKLIKKVSEGSPNIVDFLKENKINLVFNTTEGSQSIQDSKEIRALAVRNKIPYFTTAAGCFATARAIRAQEENTLEIIRIQDLENI